MRKFEKLALIRTP